MKRDIPALLAFIEGRSAMPHDWGRYRNDCISYAAYAVKAQGGRHGLGRLRWSTRRGALRVLKRIGGIEKALDARFLRIPPAAAMRGDIAGVFDPAFGIHPMIVEGDMLVGPGPSGERRLPRAAMIAAWSAMRSPEGAAS